MNSRWHGLCLALLLAPAAGFAEDGPPARCEPRESFPAFIAHFKQDAEFRQSRIVFPLAVGNGSAFGKPDMVLRSAYVDLESFPLITPEREAELAGSEGELCETTSARLDSRDFFQSSCDTDVYGHRYHFERVQGCWALTKVELSGS